MTANSAYKERLDFFDTFFFVLLILICSTLFGMGYFLQKHQNQMLSESNCSVKPLVAQLVISNKPEVIPKPEKKVKRELNAAAKTVTEKVIDLTEKKPVTVSDQEKVETSVPEKSKPVRRVFGLRKVYSQGLGATGDLSESIIGKIGNTINKEVDTFTATKDEIKGSIVSTSSLTQSPRFKKVAKPVYSPEMLENRVEGVVRLKVLIDIDGIIKKAIIISDIGFNSGQQALQAVRDMEFYPAIKGGETVAAWIVIPIRFLMLS